MTKIRPIWSPCTQFIFPAPLNATVTRVAASERPHMYIHT
jgi:hypothetical protein